MTEGWLVTMLPNSGFVAPSDSLHFGGCKRAAFGIKCMNTIENPLIEVEREIAMTEIYSCVPSPKKNQFAVCSRN